MSRSVPNGARNNLNNNVSADESVMTTLRVIMDVLKTHDGSIKQLQKWLESQESGKGFSVLEDSSSHPTHQQHLPQLPLQELPVRDAGIHHDIRDDQSDISSIVSTRTEYQELPSRASLGDSTSSPNRNTTVIPTTPPRSATSHAPLVNGFFSTPLRSSMSPPKGNPYQGTEPTVNGIPTKFDSTISSIETDTDGLGSKIGITSKVGLPVSIYENPLKSTMMNDQSPKTAHETSAANVSIGVLSTRLNFLEGQVSEWGEVMDELSDRMANQPSMIRKFAKESTTDKVSHSQHNENLEALEKRMMDRISEKFSSLDRKIIELYDDVSSRVSASPRGKDNDKKYARQDTAVQLSIDIETLSEQADEHKIKIRSLEKEISQLNETLKHVKNDVNLCRHHVTGLRSDEELVSLVAEHILDREDVTGWKEALKETHLALNKQSEINTSLHHSYASLDKKMNTVSHSFPCHGRWRWGGISSVYPRSHSCVDGQHSDDISFVAQISNLDSRAFAWEKNKPYIIIISAGCYWVTVGAFGLKSSVPPSLQVTVDEEIVPLFNSSGKSPTHQRISITSSAPKQPPQSARFRTQDSHQWKPGSSLSGALMLAAHSRVGICATSTASGTRIGVEGYLEIHRVY
ncbi:uncharacterized protein LOC5516306 [Nematostella vectensis]|uniref:uncharacterized protein LOC5516306 n=1 Tax=Nematostella vectensis TaxID=45351 RepID=UPI00207709D0|nr:uncharacterized protein LOC5516306 [Nematostella vectensis]